jgi:hypothetical protein
MSTITPEEYEEAVAYLDSQPSDHGLDTGPLAHLLDGKPLDPIAVPGAPLEPLPGFPFVVPGVTVIISGPTGKGRSSLAEVMLYDAAKAGPARRLSREEVTEDEFNARGATIADARGDEIADELVAQLSNVRYLSLADNIATAWTMPEEWTREMAARYPPVAIDPLSSVASTLGLDFDNNTQYLQFHDRIVEPLKLRGTSVVLLDNIGHSESARERPSGGAAKIWRQDLQYSCKATSVPVPGLVIECKNVRSVRVAWKEGAKWLFERDTQRVNREAPAAGTRPRRARCRDVPGTWRRSRSHSRPTATRATRRRVSARRPGAKPTMSIRYWPRW